MNLLGSLGIDIKLLIAQMINFGVLLWLLNKFIYKPIIKRIESDEETLKQVQIQSKKLEGQQKIFEEHKKKETAAMRKHGEEIIVESENLAKEIIERVNKEINEEKQAIISQIKSRLPIIENDKN